jgi:hypothetical protein
MGSVINHIENEITRLIDEHSLTNKQKQELARNVSAKLNFEAWDKAVRNIRKQLDTAVKYLSEEQYNLFLAEMQQKNDK